MSKLGDFMNEKTGTSFQVKLPVSDSKNQPYIKIDATKSCRVGDDFALNFYQFDYLKIATSLESENKIIDENSVNTVGKFTMTYTGFVNLRDELNKLFDIHQQQISLKKE